MKIAIIGIRGIPANYGGYETFAENLSVRLVDRGHQVTVYGRSNNIKTKTRKYRGVDLVILPTISHKYLDTVAHTFIATLHSVRRQKFDVVFICDAVNACFAWIPRVFGTKTVLNVDGIEREREKWNLLGKIVYLVSERLATFTPSAMVTDADAIRRYYLERYSKESTMIPYGATVTREKEGSPLIKDFGLRQDEYILYVSRLEPENNALMVIKSFEKIKTSRLLVVVGNAPYANEYIGKLKSTKDERIKFLGAIYGEGYKVLQQNAYCYIQATEVGGTHPALVEAMGFGNLVLALERPEHREVTGNAAIYFKSAEDLAEKLEKVLAQPELVPKYRSLAMARITANYSWDKVTDQYEELFKKLVGRLSSNVHPNI